MDHHINLIIADGKAYLIGVKRTDNDQAAPIYAEVDEKDIAKLIKDTKKSWQGASTHSAKRTQDTHSHAANVLTAEKDA